MQYRNRTHHAVTMAVWPPEVAKTCSRVRTVVWTVGDAAAAGIRALVQFLVVLVWLTAHIVPDSRCVARDDGTPSTHVSSCSYLVVAAS